MSTKRPKITRHAGVGTGTTSLLVIFTVLCMATLALLSLTTAASNRRINERSFYGVQDLARAEGEAAEKLAEVDSVLFEIYKQETNEKEYYSQAMELLKQKGYTVNTEENKVGFVQVIDERHALETEVKVLFPEETGQRYAITSQVSVLQGEWEPELNAEYWSGT